MDELWLVPVFALHLLVVNIATAGPAVCVWLDWHAIRQQDAVAGSLGHRLAGWSCGSVMVGAALGLLALVFLQGSPEQRRYWMTLQQVPNSRWIAIMSELVFAWVCLAIYYASWERWRRWRWLHRGLAILACTTLAFHFPPLFSMISVASTQPDWFDRPIGRAEYYSLLLDGEVMARTMHHMLASVAVVGVLIMLWSASWRAREKATAHSLEDKELSWACRAAWLALIPTALQLPVGLWLLFELPEGARKPLLGADLWGAAFFVGGLFSAVALFFYLVEAVKGRATARVARRATIWLVVVTLLMAGALHRGRTNTYRGFAHAEIANLGIE